jgi:hypothetical protein
MFKQFNSSKKEKLTPQKSSSCKSYSKKRNLTPQKSSSSKSILLRKRSWLPKSQDLQILTRRSWLPKSQVDQSSEFDSPRVKFKQINSSKWEKLTPQKSSSGKSYSKKKKLTPQKSSSSKSILLRRRSWCSCQKIHPNVL